MCFKKNNDNLLFCYYLSNDWYNKDGLCKVKCIVYSPNLKDIGTQDGNSEALRQDKINYSSILVSVAHTTDYIFNNVKNQWEFKNNGVCF